MHQFSEISDVLGGLQKLMEREPALVAVLPRQPGTKESRYAHLLSGEVATAAVTNPVPSSSSNSNAQDDRIAQLEATVAELRQELTVLQQKIDSLLS